MFNTELNATEIRMKFHPFRQIDLMKWTNDHLPDFIHRSVKVERIERKWTYTGLDANCTVVPLRHVDEAVRFLMERRK